MQPKRAMRGFLANVDILPPIVVTFQYNPDSITDARTVNYRAETRFMNSRAQQTYTGAAARTLSFQVHLHAEEPGLLRSSENPLGSGVESEIAKLRMFLYPQQDAFGSISGLLGGGGGGRRLAAPPTAIFGTGLRVLPVQVTSLSVTETQFNMLLAPVRASVTMTLTVIEDDTNPLIVLDQVRRNLLAGIGLVNIDL